MKRNVVVDPYMFKIDNEDEIKNNLKFFEKMTQHIMGNKIAIYVYEGWYEEIISRGTGAFPVPLEKIRDLKLKAHILKINTLFFSLLPNQIRRVDIDQCRGEQELISNEDLVKDPEYFEMLSVLLSECYSDISFGQGVLTGESTAVLKVGDCFDLFCSCEGGEYKKHYTMIGVDEFENPEELAFKTLKNKILSGEIKWIENPETKQAHDHHNPLQPETIRGFSSIEKSSSKVLKVLRYFGLYKIILKGYHRNSTEPAGTVDVTSVEVGDNSSIIKGALFFKSGFICEVDLFFPEKVADAIVDCVGSRLTYKNITMLKDRFCL